MNAPFRAAGFPGLALCVNACSVFPNQTGDVLGSPVCSTLLKSLSSVLGCSRRFSLTGYACFARAEIRQLQLLPFHLLRSSGEARWVNFGATEQGGTHSDHVIEIPRHRHTQGGVLPVPLDFIPWSLWLGSYGPPSLQSQPLRIGGGPSLSFFPSVP